MQKHPFSECLNYSAFRKKKILGRIQIGEKQFNCSVCEIKFSESKMWTIHKKIYIGKKQYKCEEYGQTFTLSEA